MTREKARALVYGNPEAAIDLIMELAAAVPLLRARVGELERKIALLSRDSSNSSKPPSFDGPAAKPLITCFDSGGPLEFVAHEESGLICKPTPEDLAAAMDRLWKERTLAASMGTAGRKRYLDLNLSWSSVVETLMSH